MRSQRWRHAVEWLGIGAVVAATLAGCGGGDGSDGPGAGPAVAVSVEEVHPAPVPNLVELPGRVEAIRSVQVRARADGIVERQLFVEGTDIAADAPLFQIDRRDLSAQLQQAKAGLAAAQAARGHAASMRARLASLVQRKAVSVQEFESAESALRQADAAVLEGRAALDRAQLQLDHAVVRSPIAGRVGRALVSEGALVSAGGATLLTQVDQLDPVFVVFHPSNAAMSNLERAIADGRIKLDDSRRLTVTVLLDDGQPYAQQGYVEFSEKAVDPATGSRTLRARFDNPQRQLLPGQFVRGIIAAGTLREGFSVPERAVTIGDDEASVMTVDREGIAIRRPVTLAGQSEGRWVVQSGLAAGERVVIDGWHKIQPGQRVDAQPVQAKPVPAKPRP